MFDTVSAIAAPNPVCHGPLMTVSMTVRIEDLRTALDTLLVEIERRSGTEIELDADQYWEVYPTAAFDLYSKPDPTVGQLSDDLDTLREVISQRSGGEIHVWHDLAHILGILRRLAALGASGSTS